ncbi:hypothetical protein [Brucella thiophenivorans]|uniref:Uncharacterized protein n=1 Tax=Brucella thiophenivorans TaxID=571255 RepID=A0A256FYY3_9HYPH|nr:hypothetical protein [Brucella thiophenivorans]OYR20053.1 hypothetical protein CEV31_1474 [Brucella thiophenivorans]
MSEKTIENDKQNQPDPREKRRAEQLRANLMRRKVQSRSRRAGDADERDDGITAGKEKND